MSKEEFSEYKRIYRLVYNWGIEHDTLLDLKTEDDEIKHFGKRIKDFTMEEKRGYKQGCCDLEYHFEVAIPYMKERAADCDDGYDDDDEWNVEWDD